MNLDRLFAIGGFVLGIPGVVALFFSADVSVGASAIVVAFLAIALSFAVTYYKNRPPYKFKKAEATLDIKARDGSVATLTKIYKFVPNIRDQHTFIHRNIAADGTVNNFQWENGAIDPHWLRKVLHQYEVTIDFGYPPLRVGQTVDHKLQYDVLNSFPAQKEGWFFVVEYPFKHLHLTLKFPEDRPITSLESSRTIGASVQSLGLGLDAVKAAGNRQYIELDIKKPKLGAQYEIWWRW